MKHKKKKKTVAYLNYHLSCITKETLLRGPCVFWNLSLWLIFSIYSPAREHLPSAQYFGFFLTSLTLCFSILFNKITLRQCLAEQVCHRRSDRCKSGTLILKQSRREAEPDRAEGLGSGHSRREVAWPRCRLMCMTPCVAHGIARPFLHSSRCCFASMHYFQVLCAYGPNKSESE